MTDLPEPPPPITTIQASELAHYSFCQRAWWLSNVQQLTGSTQPQRSRGTAWHKTHAKRVKAISLWRRASYFLLGGGIFLIVISGIILLW
ncbi:MAG: hypothetical protein AAF485_28305 [Chloroflexota bacterium]